MSELNKLWCNFILQVNIFINILASLWFHLKFSLMLTIVFLFVLGQYVSGQSLSCYSDCLKMAYYKCNICYDSCSPIS